MGAQLDRLIESANTPGIVIQVLPFTADNRVLVRDTKDRPGAVLRFSRRRGIASPAG